MNIAQALKEKNRATGRITTLQNTIKKYNVRKEGTNQDFDIQDIYSALQTEWAQLILLKEKISKANVGIADKLVAIAEAKAELKFWQELWVTAQEKSFIKVEGYGENKNEVCFTSFFSQKETLDKIEEIQGRIENLQDAIDSYNATTVI